MSWLTSRTSPALSVGSRRHWPGLAGRESSDGGPGRACPDSRQMGSTAAPRFGIFARMSKEPKMSREERKAYEEALRRIEECRSRGRSLLDLNSLRLTKLPPEIGQLTALTHLNAYNNRLTSLPPEIG